MEWGKWVSTFLSPYIPNAAGVDYNATRGGLTTATLIHNVVLPPDAWVPGRTAPRERATLEVQVCDLPVISP